MSELKALIQTDAAKRQIMKALPKHVDTERFVRSVLTAMNKNPKLQNCTQSSFFNALLDSAEIGLQPNGRDAHLVPYGNTVTFLVDYKGLIKLAFRSGSVSGISANVVFAGDLYDYESNRHVPWGWRNDAAKPDDQGKPVGAYCKIQMKDGTEHVERMTFDEIESVRTRSKSGSSASSPWSTDWSEMAKKTVFRRAAKWIPTNDELESAFERDGDVLKSVEPAIKIDVEAKSAGDAVLEQLDAKPTDDE